MAITDSKELLIEKRGYRQDIAGDQYAVYLSNYPAVAGYLAERLAGKGASVAELCCGIGVTLEALAPVFHRLVGVDHDASIIEDCRRNLERAGVVSKVTLIEEDVTDAHALQKIHADVVIYDIPYWVSKILPDGTNVLDHNPDFASVVGSIRHSITNNIVISAPPYFTYSSAVTTLGACEFERIFINDRHDRNYIYSGTLMKTGGVTEKYLVG